MIRIPLIALPLFYSLYGWRQPSLSPVLGFATLLACAIGLALVIRAGWSSKAANFVGVGRGADLVLHAWAAISILVLANVHFRLRALQAKITALIREIAWHEAHNQPQAG